MLPVDPQQDAPGPQDDVVVDIDEVTAGSGALVVRAGATAGQRISLELPLTRLGRHPAERRQPRRHHRLAPPRRDRAAGRRRLRGPRRRLAERDLRQRRAGREGPAAQRRRGPDRQVPDGVPGRARRYRVSDHALPVDRRGAAAPAGRVPGRHDLQDPLPREPGPDRPGAHAVGLPQVLRPRHRPAEVHPARAEGQLPAAQGDQGPARRGGGHRPGAAAAPAGRGDRRRGRRPAARRRPRPSPRCAPRSPTRRRRTHLRR